MLSRYFPTSLLSILDCILSKNKLLYKKKRVQCLLQGYTITNFINMWIVAAVFNSTFSRCPQSLFKTNQKPSSLVELSLDDDDRTPPWKPTNLLAGQPSVPGAPQAGLPEGPVRRRPEAPRQGGAVWRELRKAVLHAGQDHTGDKDERSSGGGGRAGTEACS